MDEINEVALKHKLSVIEDACQSHGAIYKGKKTGWFKNRLFSFYTTKNMTTGEGGMITTNNEKFHESTKIVEFTRICELRE